MKLFLQAFVNGTFHVEIIAILRQYRLEKKSEVLQKTGARTAMTTGLSQCSLYSADSSTLPSVVS